MKKIRRSYSSMLNIVLAVIVFAIVLVIAMNLYKTTTYGGRIECKVAYSLSAPFGMFANTGVVMEQAGTYMLAAVTIAIAAIATYGAIKEYRTVTAIKEGLKIPSYEKILSKISDPKTLWQIKQASKSDIVISGIKRVFSNQKLIKALGYTGVAGITAYGLGAVSNQIAINLQEPILNSLCKTDNYILITDYDMNIANLEIERSTYNNTKKEYYKKLSDEDKTRFYTAFFIARKVLDTYGESLGGSVKLGKVKMHYIIFLNYTLDNKPIRISDIVAILDFMEVKVKGNVTSYYKLLFGETSAREIKAGEIFSSYCNHMSIYTGKCPITISNDGSDKVIGSMLDLNTNTIYEALLIDKKGLYVISIIYDGLGSVYIKSYYYG